MELREYYKILRANVAVIIYTAIIAVVIAYAWSVRTSQTYSTSLLLSVSRAESQQTADYRYDQFYRLQADEKFSETVVEWLKSPGVAQDIFAKAGVSSDQKTLRQLAKSFRAEKISSELVSVSFSPGNEDEAKKIASAISDVVSTRNASLNAETGDPSWFKVEKSDLITRKNTQDLRLNLGVAALAGVFIGAFLALGKYYIQD